MASRSCAVTAIPVLSSGEVPDGKDLSFSCLVTLGA